MSPAMPPSSSRSAMGLAFIGFAGFFSLLDNFLFVVFPKQLAKLSN
jgi:hypothetical protein